MIFINLFFLSISLFLKILLIHSLYTTLRHLYLSAGIFSFFFYIINVCLFLQLHFMLSSYILCQQTINYKYPIHFSYIAFNQTPTSLKITISVNPVNIHILLAHFLKSLATICFVSAISSAFHIKCAPKESRQCNVRF